MSLPTVDGASRFDHLWFRVFPRDAVGQPDVVIEHVTEHVFEGIDGSSRIATEIEDKRLVLSGFGEDGVDGALFGEEAGHLPDEGVAILGDAFAVVVGVFLVPANGVPEVVVVAVARYVEENFAGAKHGTDDFFSLLSRRSFQGKLFRRRRREDLEEIQHIAEAGALYAEAIERENLIAYVQSGCCVRARAYARDEAFIAHHLCMKADGRPVGSRWRHEEVWESCRPVRKAAMTRNDSLIDWVVLSRASYWRKLASRSTPWYLVVVVILYIVIRLTQHHVSALEIGTAKLRLLLGLLGEEEG
jgi:hypothetical protein